MSRIVYPSVLINVAFALLLATPIVTALSRNVAFLLLMVCAVLLVVAVALQPDGAKKLANAAQRVFSLAPNAPAGAIAFAIIVFALLSLLWSPPAPARGFGAVAGASTAALVCIYCCVLIARHMTIPSWLAWGVSLAIAVGCLLVIFEVTLGSPIRSSLGASTEAFRLNRAAVAVAIMTPLLLMSPLNIVSSFLKLIVFLLVWNAVFSSLSESAKLAIITVTAVWAFSFVIKPKILLAVCGAGVIISHVFAPIIGWGIYTFISPDAFAAVGYASQHWRAIIWWAYASEIWNAPVFGHGVQASASAGKHYTGQDSIIQSGLNFLHPHNFSIQVWYELGLLGVVLSTLLLLILIRRLLRLPNPRTIVVAAALIAGIWSVAYVSHGAWQHWWWALVGIMAIHFVGLERLDDEQKPRGDGKKQ